MTREAVATRKAVAVLTGNGVYGIVRFSERSGRHSGVQVTVSVTGVHPPSSWHALHIHKYGDLTRGCESTCEHFDISGSSHGGRDDAIRHTGDLGNVWSNASGVVQESFVDKHISIDPSTPHSILGRSIVLHEDRDDNGRGRNEASRKNGNAGRRIACGVVGIAAA